MGETAKIDSTGAVCPTTFVTVKDGLEDGEILEIRLNGGEAIQNVPRSLKNEGHKVTKAEKGGDGLWLLRVVKGGLAL
ncbi:MAG: sulfurtransferase TusA family protein [Treponema sp.]|jgi:TusA-related sulfurtransferase|nr:sulfurtransferase TusA family protein [Treponema sp.]